MASNEKEVAELLSRYGFRPLEPHTLSFKEQIVTFSNTKYLVALHGAALTNCVFMQPDSHVLELHPDISNEKSIFNISYWNLCHYFGLHYYFQGCSPVNTKERFHTANLIVDLKKLEENIIQMLATS
jgi:capsular polysaccharide biosynthesis protein